MKECMEDRGDIFYIRVLNVLACFAVVMLHCNGIFWSRPTGRLWVTSNFIEVTMYWAVPVFFMNAGVTNMEYRQKYTTREFLVRRFQKVGIPFVFWSLFSLMLSAVSDGTRINASNIYASIANSAYLSIYWFFVPLFAVYLSMPLLTVVLPEKRKHVFGYLISYAVLTISVFPLLCNLLHLKYNAAIQPPVAAAFMLYVLLGYWIHHYPLSKRCRYAIYMAGIAGWLLHFGGTLLLSGMQEGIPMTFKGYTNIPCVLYSTAVLLYGFSMAETKMQMAVQSNLFFWKADIWHLSDSLLSDEGNAQLVWNFERFYILESFRKLFDLWDFSRNRLAAKETAGCQKNCAMI